MADCSYCLEIENPFVVTKLDSDNQFEVEVVAGKSPYPMVLYLNNGWLANRTIGMPIKYCPVCGRRLTND